MPEHDALPPDTRCDLLLKGAAVVTLDAENGVIERGGVAVRGDRIIAVGSDTDLAGLTAERVVDCVGMVIMPGLIDCHTHMFQGLGRTLGEALPLWTWLAEFMWPYATSLTTEDARVAATIGAVEAARSGTTALLDHHFAPTDAETTLAVADAIEAVGLRGVVGRGMSGPATEVARENNLAGDLFSRSVAEEVAITRDCVHARPPGGRVAIWPAPQNVAFCDRDLVRQSIGLARDLGTGWHAHCSVRPDDPLVFEEKHGLRPVEWLASEDLLGPGVSIAHGIHLDDSEVARMGAAGAGVAYCPASLQYGAYGALRLRDLKKAGAVVGLGTDGPGYTHRLDMLDACKQSIYVQRMHTLDPLVTDAQEALELATREGARILGIEAGALVPGNLADITVVNLQRPHLKPMHHVVSALAYAVSASDVHMTVVGGQVVYEDGRCTLVDEEEVMAQAQKHATDLIRRAGLGRFTGTATTRPAGHRGP
ncbi:amidohydrolase family protein [Actinomadura madurae]|uniref:amidohydrolase family protein n=1 Tax=Actinomadura madurae TaxID=1993 RepID=UPI002026745E|nr:amidohydrolase [Actinomadura madurae]MCQ0008342.1 amidohydrolase [Actinomadura madurae]MCQ0016344.1 amidohydrolase [Actinomadura madurae]URM96437.1 amidohydrolase [Actinomadura madurae]